MKNTTGQKIEHDIFGIGEIKLQTQTEIYVQFPQKDELICFKYPSNESEKSFRFIDDCGEISELYDFLVSYIMNRNLTKINLWSLSYIVNKEFYLPKKQNPAGFTENDVDGLIERLNKLSLKKFEFDKKNQIIRTDNKISDITLNEITEKLINFITRYIRTSKPKAININQLYNYACSNFFYPNNIPPFEFSEAFLKRTLLKINQNKLEKYEINENSLIMKNYSDTKSELIDFLCNYILTERPNDLSKIELANIVSKKFYKGTHRKQISLKNITGLVVSKVNKDPSIEYQLLEGDNLRKIKDLNPIKIKTAENNIKKRELFKPPIIKVTNSANNEIVKIDDKEVIIELIKSMILCSPVKRNFYTVHDIREYFLNFFHKDPGDLITKKLLIDACVQLYEEEKKYYFVDGENRSLQLCKANSISEWQRYGLGTVYIPTIQVNEKKYDVRNFTLYVYENLNNVKCVSLGHNLENVAIRTNNISGNLISFNAFYCSACKKYFTTRDVIENDFPLKNYPFVKLNFYGFSGNFRRDESELMVYGYTVKADGPIDSERQNLLARLMIFDFLSKARIVAIIKDHINYNGRRTNMENAVKKWQDDLKFVQNFNLSKQRTINSEKVNLV